MNRKKRLLRAVSLALACLLTVCLSLTGFAQEAGITSEEVQDVILNAYDDYRSEMTKDPVRLEEVTARQTPVRMPEYYGFGTVDVDLDVYTIILGETKMQYMMQVYGNPDEHGLYPLYIALHGGGGGPEEENNQQWAAMQEYYTDEIRDGIYVATRGMEDVWNTHFLEDSYRMYDRLIEDMILFHHADPNRVYLMGYSAGGDGVYAIAPRMADRFAGVNMSSGHPNSASLLNTANLPFLIQVGIRDYYSEDAMRSVRGAEFENTLNAYHDRFGFGYPHRVLVHVPNGHYISDYTSQSGDTRVLTDPGAFARRAVGENMLGRFMEVYADHGHGADVSSLSYAANDEAFNADLLELVTGELGLDVTEDVNPSAVAYVSSFVRNPAPDRLVWDLSTRANGRKNTAFYWLKADFSVNQGLVYAAFDRESNTLTLDGADTLNGDFSILANPFLMDFSRPLTVRTPSGSCTVPLSMDAGTIASSIRETGDPFLAWAQEIPFSSLTYDKTTGGTPHAGPSDQSGGPPCQSAQAGPEAAVPRRI